jgi:hypothetical protein
MLKTILINGARGKALHTADVGISTSDPVLVAHTEASIVGVFQFVSRTSAGTTIITTPVAGGSLILTDMLISADKAVGGKVTVCFNDGTNEQNVISFNTDDKSLNETIAFAGRFQGWKDARLEVVTIANFEVDVTAGYYKVDTSRDFADWNAQR